MQCLKSLLILGALICLTQARDWEVPKGFKPTNGTSVGIRSALSDPSPYPWMGSLQRATDGGYSCFGFPTPFVTASWAIQIPSIIFGLLQGPLNVKKLVIVSGSVSPDSAGKIHRIKKIVGTNSPFYVIKTSDEVHPWVKIAPKSYTLDPTASAIYLYWGMYQDALYDNTAILYSPTACVPSPATYCTDPFGSLFTHIGAPMLNENGDLIGFLQDSSATYEEFYFVPYFRDTIYDTIKAN